MPALVARIATRPEETSIFVIEKIAPAFDGPDRRLRIGLAGRSEIAQDHVTPADGGEVVTGRTAGALNEPGRWLAGAQTGELQFFSAVIHDAQSPPGSPLA